MLPLGLHPYPPPIYHFLLPLLLSSPSSSQSLQPSHPEPPLHVVLGHVSLIPNHSFKPSAAGWFRLPSYSGGN